MKVTIFGGTGRIGAHAAAHALECGYDVLVSLAHPKSCNVNTQTSPSSRAKPTT